MVCHLGKFRAKVGNFGELAENCVKKAEKLLFQLHDSSYTNY